MQLLRKLKKNKYLIVDPITEEQAAITGNPIKAYEFQNHEAYIASHMVLF